MRTSTPPWPAISAAVGPITASARRSSTPLRGHDMSQGLLDAQSGARAARGFSRRAFLKFGVTVGAAAGGGLLLGFSMPAASQDQKAGKSVIGGDGVEKPQSGGFP